MKVLCPGCDRLAPLDEVRLEAEGVLATCRHCGHQERVPLGSVQAPEQGVRAQSRPGPRSPALSVGDADPPLAVLPGGAEDLLAVPPGHCLKCGAAPQPGAAACTRCGLAYGRAAPEHLAPSEWLSAEWRRLLARWSDPAAHDGLLKEASRRGELAATGRLYQLRLSRRPTDTAAARGREEVLRLAALLPAQAPSPAPEAGRDRRATGLVLIVGGAAVLLVLALWLLP